MSKNMDCCAPEVSTAQNRGARTTSDVIRSALSDRRVLMTGGIVAATGALALNWSWVTAIGAASIILALAPCAVMCALGLCMNMRRRANPPVDKPVAGEAAGASELTPARIDGVPS